MLWEVINMLYKHNITRFHIFSTLYIITT
jgi:hypothetical protein